MDNFKKYYKNAIKFEKKNDFDLAIDSYKKALIYNNKSIKCLEGLVNIYEKLNDYYNVIECYEKMISASSDIKLIVIKLNEIGMIYSKLLKYEEAIHYFKKTLNYTKNIPDVYSNIGICYISLKQYKLAEVSFLIYLNLKKDDNIYRNLGNLYFYIKKYEESISYYEKITNINDDPRILYNLSFPYMAKKNYEYGFKLYENRLKFNDIDSQTKEITRLEVDIPYWNDSETCGSLLIIYEQGIGDNIMYYRFIIELSNMYPNLKITYFCKNSVSHLFKEYKNITILNDSLPVFNINENFNYKLYIMSLPYLLKINKIISNKEMYINVNDERKKYWNNKLQILKKNPQTLNVGFVYNGLLSSFIEKNIPLQEFKLLTDLNINLICLHKKSDVIADLNSNLSLSDKIITFDIDIDKAFIDTIAIMQNIDILISIDTSIVHLAGVLNIKTLLLLGTLSDWRWFDDSKKVWYESVEILRMTENKDLKYILPQVKNILSNILKTQNNCIDKEEK